MILIIDNYDSFTYNLVHLIGRHTDDLKVVRNDALTVDAVRAMAPDGILISPGPGRPEDAGISKALIRELGETTPILGVCLGHQAIGEVFGGDVIHAPTLMHGKTSTVQHDGRTIYEGVAPDFTATRYHSLVVDRDSLPPVLEISSETADGVIMGFRHREWPIEGIQFHPESVLTIEGSPLEWQELDSWITPNDKFFAVNHYNWPVIDAQSWSLSVGGRTGQPLSFTLDELRARPRREVVFTLECSGNHGFDWFVGGIGTARWAGTPLAPILEEAQIADDGREVVFFGADQSEEVVNETKIVESFGRSMSLADAMSPDNLLCYEMNGVPLPDEHGFPVRLIAPGWFGIANVKWLQRIEVRSSRYMGRFMAQDYVTLREEQQDGQSAWRRSSVGRALLKSVPAKVTRSDGQHRILGAAWGAPIERVEVRIDDGPWQEATIDQSEQGEFAWKIWSLDWPDAAPGEHTVTSRAIDPAGNVQPTQDDPMIANKHTYWESNGQVTRRVGI